MIKPTLPVVASRSDKAEHTAGKSWRLWQLVKVAAWWTCDLPAPGDMCFAPQQASHCAEHHSPVLNPTQELVGRKEQ